MEDNKAPWYESLYEAHAAQVILYGRALGLSHGESEDVLHDTFLALMRLASPPEKPLHYCLSSFRNRALNHRRGLFRRMTRELESLRWFERTEGETGLERTAMRCLRRLPQEQREVIVLKIWHQYTFQAIGELLQVSPHTAAGRYRCGLLKIKACLKETEYERTGMVGESITLLETASPFGGA